MAEAAIELCPICGGLASDCQDPSKQSQWRALDPVRCHRTTALRERQAGYDETTNPHLDALTWRVGLVGGTDG